MPSSLLGKRYVMLQAFSSQAAPGSGKQNALEKAGAGGRHDRDGVGQFCDDNPTGARFTIKSFSNHS
jgi:hypothetical protein